MSSRRHLARVVVMQSLFVLSSRPEINVQKELEKNITDLGGSSEVDAEHAELLLGGVVQYKEAIAAELQLRAPEWPIERMDTVTRTILFLGVYELLHCKDVPKAVAINEAIELAKEFVSEDSGKFVNGVLNAVANPESAS